MMKALKSGRSGRGISRRAGVVLRKAGFTLIELLVVVSIILVLMGISLKVMSVVNQKASSGKTSWIVEQVKNALASYYATYGSYPPVNTVKYVTGVQMPSEVAITAQANWTTGLVYYIYSSDGNGDYEKYYNSDAKPWQHFLKGIGSSGTTPTNVTVGAWYGGLTNISHTIYDAWGHELKYASFPPDYQRYILYSVGPDGKTNTADDIGVQGLE